MNIVSALQITWSKNQAHYPFHLPGQSSPGSHIRVSISSQYTQAAQPQPWSQNMPPPSQPFSVSPSVQPLVPLQLLLLCFPPSLGSPRLVQTPIHRIAFLPTSWPPVHPAEARQKIFRNQDSNVSLFSNRHGSLQNRLQNSIPIP